MALLNRTIIAACCTMFIACSGSLDKDTYIRWVETEKNGLTKKHKEKGLEYTVTYCPIDYMIAKEFKTNAIKSETYRHRKKDLEGFEYFKLRIRKENSKEEVLMEGLQSESEYIERIDYLSYGFDENLFIVRNDFKDTVPVALYHFERTYGLVPYIDFIISFKEDTALKDNRIQFLLNDNIFGNGIVTREFNKKDILETPILKLN